MNKIVEATLDAAGEQSDWIGPTEGTANNSMNLSIECDSAWDGTLQLMRKRDGGTEKVVKEYITDAEEVITDPVKGTTYSVKCSARTAGSASPCRPPGGWPPIP